jgi:hypothetical protein
MALGRDDNKSSLPGGKTPKFEIFAGHSGSNDVLWLETVEGLAAARSRMEEIAAQKPGPTLYSSRPITVSQPPLTPRA